jgi:hypothetical protein
MVILGLAFVPVMCGNVRNEIAALALLRGADFLSALGEPHREAMAMLFLDLHRYGCVIGWIFGPWLFFFDLLVFIVVALSIGQRLYASGCLGS